jgi:hypothetical protein
MFDVDQIIEENDSQLYEDHKESEVNNLLDYFESAYIVKERTVKEHRDTIYESIKLVEKYRDCYTAYIKTGWETLANVSLELSEDIEASIFLSMHGMYIPANALLRLWLETSISALKFDYELKKCDKNTKTYDELLKKRDKWLENPSHVRFTGECSILSTLIDPDTDYIATQFIKEEMFNSEKLIFKKEIENLFKELSKYVHFGGMTPIENFKSTFAKYDKEQFENWSKRLNQINEMCTIITLIKFPEIITLLKNCRDRCLPTLGDKRNKKLEELLKSNKIF